jgi:hypothetical protein
MSDQDKCPICRFKDCKIKSPSGPRDIYSVSCKHCGDFQIEHNFLILDLTEFAPSYLLSGAIRNLYEKGQKIELFREEDFKRILDSVKIPKDPFEKMDLLIKYIYNKMEYMGAGVEMQPSLDFPLLYAENYHEFMRVIDMAGNLDLIELDDIKKGYRLGLSGWQRMKELLQKEVKSNQAFVAMWFDKNLDVAWKRGFKPALIETGYTPLRIDLKEHNEKICDIIIAEIQDSGLLVADFTGQRGGVYFEAGFASIEGSGLES